MGNCLLLVSFAAARAGVTQGPPPPHPQKGGSGFGGSLRDFRSSDSQGD